MFVRFMSLLRTPYSIASRLVAAMVLLCFSALTAEASFHVHECHVPTQVQIAAAHDDDGTQDCELCNVTLAAALSPQPLDVSYLADVVRLAFILPDAAPAKRVALPAGPSRAPPRP